MSTLILILKKVHRFLQCEMKEKKMIDVHVVNKKKRKKYIDSYRRKKMFDVHAVKKKKKRI